METVLNFAWLALALTSALLWAAYWRKFVFVRGRRVELLRSAVGLICVLVLMFFAISLTDDLYELTTLAEEPAFVAARSCKAAIAQSRITQPLQAAGVAPSTLNLLRAWRVIRMVPAQPVVQACVRSPQPANLRAPPLAAS